jgi:hypothetical protein
MRGKTTRIKIRTGRWGLSITGHNIQSFIASKQLSSLGGGPTIQVFLRLAHAIGPFGLLCERFWRPQRFSILSVEHRCVNRNTPKENYKFKKVRAGAGFGPHSAC